MLQDSYHDNHPECSSQEAERPDLALLSGCTLFHTEAALLPFKLNTFAFEGYGAICQFADRVYAQQASLLKKTLLLYKPRIQLHHSTTNPHFWKFKGLKTLNNLVEANSSSLWTITPDFARYEKQLHKDLLRFQKLPFETVTIFAYQAKEDSPHALALIQQRRHMKTLRQAYEELQRALAVSWPKEWEKNSGRVKWLKSQLKPGKVKKGEVRRGLKEQLERAEENLECHCPGT